MKLFSKKLWLQNYLRIVKQKGTPDSVGRGAAIGLFVAFFIPISIQMIIAYCLAVLLKASKIPALLFTWLSNPLTIPFLYPLQCYIGSHIIQKPLSYHYTQETFSSIIIEPSFSKIFSLSKDVALSFFAGGLLFGTIAAFIGYLASIRLVIVYRQNKEKRLNKRIQFFQLRAKKRHEP